MMRTATSLQRVGDRSSIAGMSLRFPTKLTQDEHEGTERRRRRPDEECHLDSPGEPTDVDDETEGEYCGADDPQLGDQPIARKRDQHLDERQGEHEQARRTGEQRHVETPEPE